MDILTLASIFSKKAAEFEEAFEEEREEPSYKVVIPPGALNEDFYQWGGQGDPLYAVMSRANADYNEDGMQVSESEFSRLADMAEQVLDDPETKEESKEAAMEIMDQYRNLVGEE